jgi:hypothetical protein
VRNVGVFRAVGELRRRLDPQFAPGDWSGAGQGTLNTPITLSLTRTTPRAILNEIARRHGRLTWSSSFDGGDASVANWIVTLVPLDNAGPPIAHAANGGSVAPPPSAAAMNTSSPMTIAPGARPITLDLPVTGMTLRSMLQQASRVTGVSIGFAGVTPASTLRTPPAEYYNLTGLSIDEILEKVRMLAPEYAISIDRGVVHVRLRNAPTDLAQYLDQRIPKFEERFENLRDAMQAVATIDLFPSRALGPGGGGAGARGAPPLPGRGVPPGTGVAPPPNVVSPGLSAMNERLQKPIVLSMTNATVREILDEIARQFGSMTWVLEQRMTPAGSGMSLMFSSDSWSIGTGVR